MAVAHVGTDSSSFTTGGGATSLTFAHTVPAGSNRLLVVAVATRDNVASVPMPTGVTFNGVAMTRHEDNVVGEYASTVWRLVAPTETTANVVITMTNSSSVAGAALNYTGVDQAVPLGTPNGNTGNSTAVTIDVTAVSGDLVLDAAMIAFAVGPPTVGAGQTQRINIVSTGGTVNDVNLGVSEEAGAATVTMSWTAAAIVTWAIGGVPIRPTGSLRVTKNTRSFPLGIASGIAGAMNR